MRIYYGLFTLAVACAGCANTASVGASSRSIHDPSAGRSETEAMVAPEGFAESRMAGRTESAGSGLASQSHDLMSERASASTTERRALPRSAGWEHRFRPRR